MKENTTSLDNTRSDTERRGFTSRLRKLQALGPLSADRRVHQHAKQWLPAQGYGQWEPLVPKYAFYESALGAIARRQHTPSSEFGNCVEFGVSRAILLATVFKAEGLSNVRLIRFDSIGGLPEEARHEGWPTDMFESTLSATRA